MVSDQRLRAQADDQIGGMAEVQTQIPVQKYVSVLVTISMATNNGTKNLSSVKYRTKQPVGGASGVC